MQQCSNMNIDNIHNVFEKTILMPGIYRKIGIPKNNVAQYRWKLKRGIKITIDKKLWVLQRAGYRFESLQYTDKDLVDILTFALNASQATRNMGPQYLLEKWKYIKISG